MNECTNKAHWCNVNALCQNTKGLTNVFVTQDLMETGKNDLV